ncbi:MAG: D-alanyl-D-alanine carboxypeptidase/D-alanyl-D-alanine-endopeptidase, partial [Planctomycetota bacterium]
VFLAGLVLLRQALHGGSTAGAPGQVEAAAGSSGPVGERPAPPPAPPIPEAEREQRTRRVDAIVARWVAEAERRSKGKVNAGNVSVAVHAVEVGGARRGELVARLSDRALRPASNMKLVTTAVALTLLGPDWHFETRLDSAAPIEGGVLRGDAVVRAGGDPLTDDDGTGVVEARLDALVDGLRARGVTRIEGAVLLDEGSFARPAPPPGWPDSSQHWTDYCALSGGFTVNGGVLRATLARGSGSALDVRVHPAPYGLRSNYGVRVGSKNDVRVGATVSACTVKGELPSAAVDGWQASFSHPDPVDLFESVLRDRFARAGIEVAGGFARRRGPPPESSAVLATMRSPLADVLVPINTHSVNGVADQVFLATGAAVVGDGSRQGGMAATARALERLGVPAGGLEQVDGSGLSRDNRASARQIVALMEAVHGMQPAVREAFFRSLPVAGETGTLSKRMRGSPAQGRVFAKTGWISGASALSGLERTPSGRQVLFSILVEYPRHVSGMNTHAFKPMQDELVLALFEEAP